MNTRTLTHTHTHIHTLTALRAMLLVPNSDGLWHVRFHWRIFTVGIIILGRVGVKKNKQTSTYMLSFQQSEIISLMMVSRALLVSFNKWKLK